MSDRLQKLLHVFMHFWKEEELHERQGLMMQGHILRVCSFCGRRELGTVWESAMSGRMESWREVRRHHCTSRCTRDTCYDG